MSSRKKCLTIVETLNKDGNICLRKDRINGRILAEWSPFQNKFFTFHDDEFSITAIYYALYENGLRTKKPVSLLPPDWTIKYRKA